MEPAFPQEKIWLTPGTALMHKTFADVESHHDTGKKSRGPVGFITSVMQLERNCNTTGTIGADSDAVSLGKVVGLLLVHTEVSHSEPHNSANSILLGVIVKKVTICNSGEGVPWLIEDLLQMLHKNEQVLFDVWTSQAYICAHGASGCLQKQDLYPVTRAGEGHDLISAKIPEKLSI